MKSNGNKRRSGSSKNKPRRAFSLEKAGDQIVKRMTLAGQALTTSARGAIVVTAYGSGAVESTPATEWASFAARYQQYRVRAIRVSGKATQPIQTATVSHSVLYRGDYIGLSAPTTAPQVLSDENVRTNATDKDFRDVVTWKRNPNAKLWASTAGGIPTQNTFAWVCASATTPALATSTTYYALVVEWEVEFRGSQ
jgi:hypothetical protein